MLLAILAFLPAALFHLGNDDQLLTNAQNLDGIDNIDRNLGARANHYIVGQHSHHHANAAR